MLRYVLTIPRGDLGYSYPDLSQEYESHGEYEASKDLQRPRIIDIRKHSIVAPHALAKCPPSGAVKTHSIPDPKSAVYSRYYTDKKEQKQPRLAPEQKQYDEQKKPEPMPTNYPSQNKVASHPTLLDHHIQS